MMKVIVVFKRLLASGNYQTWPPTGGKFAVAGQEIAGASENFVLNY